MENMNCKQCGSNAFEKRNGFWTCKYCGTVYSVAQMRSGGVSATASAGASDSSIDLDDDVTILLNKCRTDPRNARKYATLVLDIDPTNAETYIIHQDHPKERLDTLR